MHRTLRALFGQALLALALATAPRAGELQVHVIDVDQGSAAFVLGPDGTRVLIDGGPQGEGFGAVRPYLLSLGVTDLDVAVMTHWHADHYRGLTEVFQAGMKPDVAYDRGDFLKPSFGIVTDYLNAAAGVRATPTLGETIALGDGAVLEFVGLNGQTIGGATSIDASDCQYENALSIQMVVRYGEFELYVGGDVTAGGSSCSAQSSTPGPVPDVEGPMATALGQVEVVIASHHGSNTSSSQTVVGALDPSLVLYSAGVPPGSGGENEYGHPATNVVNRWNASSASRVAWCTTEGESDPVQAGYTPAGTVAIATDGREFTATSTVTGESLRFATFEHPGAPVGSSLKISELLVDPASVADGYGEWFELTNTSIQPMDLGGLRLQSGTSSFTLTSRVLLDQGERLVVAVDGKAARNGGVFADVVAPAGQFGLANSASSLRTIDPTFAVIGEVAWGGAGSPVQPGVSTERVNQFGLDSAANFQPAVASWDGGDLGTPGAVNGADATLWPASLGNWPQPVVGGELTLQVASLSEPLHFYLLLFSAGFGFPGFPLFDFQVLLAPDAVLNTFLAIPGTFGNLGSAGAAEFSLPLPNDPNLAGVTLYANALTFQFAITTLLPKSQSGYVFATIGQ